MAKARKDERGRALRKGEVQRASDKRYMYTYTDPLGRRKFIYAQDLTTLREKEKRGSLLWVLDKTKTAIFAIANVAAHVIGWVVVAPVLDILIYAEPVKKVFTQGVTAFVANVIIIGILGTLLLVAYSKVGAKSGSLSKED